MAHPRQRLRPWLIDQINSGEYPGLRWTDQEKMVFRIPWKHFGRPGVNEQRDAMLFRAWAVHTGRHRDGEPADLSTWKTRFRCALYKLPDIEECSSENRLDGDDPFRVYRFKSKEETAQPAFDPYGQASVGSIASPPSSEDRVAQGLEEIRNDVIRDAFIKIENGEIDGSGLADIADLRDSLSDIGILDPDSFLKGVIDSDNIDPNYEMSPASSCSTSSVAMGNFPQAHSPHPAVQQPYPAAQTQEQAPPVQVFPLAVKLHLMGKEVGHCTVTNAMGLRIAFRPPPPLPEGVASDDNVEVVSHVFGPFQAEQVYFPPSDNPQVALVLEFMNRGLVLQAREGNIHATRLCQAKVFYSSSFQANPVPKELRREDTTKVFDLKEQFLPMLQKYAQGLGPLPSYELFFSFGQRWSQSAPLKDNMVYVSVTHCLAEEHLKAFLNRSNQSSQVLYSEPNVLDEIARQIADLNVSSTNRNPSPIMMQ